MLDEVSRLGRSWCQLSRLTESDCPLLVTDLQSIESLDPGDEPVRGPAELAKRQVLAKSGHVLAAGDPRPVPQLVPGTVRQATLGSLTANQAKLITLISHFGKCATDATERESWLRSMPLLVLIYEGIQLGVFEFDFAPQSRLVNHSGLSRRIYMNISQEGSGAIDDLLEWGLIRSLKMISKQHHLVTAYQITDAGREYVAGVDEQHKVVAPSPHLSLPSPVAPRFEIPPH